MSASSSPSSERSTNRSRERSRSRSLERDDSSQLICFRVANNLESLRSLTVKQGIVSALAARATGLADIVKTAKGFQIEKPAGDEDTPWPSAGEATGAASEGTSAAAAGGSSSDSEGDNDSGRRRRRPSDASHEHRSEGGANGSMAPEVSLFVLLALRASREQIRQLCKDLVSAGVRTVGVSSMDSLYMVCETADKAALAEALIQEGHGVRPVTEVYDGPSASALAAAGLSGLRRLPLCRGVSRLQDLERFAGAWAEEDGTVASDGADPDSGNPEGDAEDSGKAAAKAAFKNARRLRFISRRGLFAEVHFTEPYRAIAGCLSLEDSASRLPGADAKEPEIEDGEADASMPSLNRAVRKIAVDSEPFKCEELLSTQVCKNEMQDLPEGVRWRRISCCDSDGLETWEVAAAELLREQATGKGSRRNALGLRAGAWVFCGELALQVVGPPRGEGIIGSTSCSSLAQLEAIEGSEAVEKELETRFEASCGLVEGNGSVRRQRGLGLRSAAEGDMLCGAQKSDGGFKTVGILYSTGLMTKGGSVTVENEGLQQVWRIRELQANPFLVPGLRISKAGAATPAGGRAAPMVGMRAPKGGLKGSGKLSTRGTGLFNRPHLIHSRPLKSVISPPLIFRGSVRPVSSFGAPRAPYGGPLGKAAGKGKGGNLPPLRAPAPFNARSGGKGAPGRSLSVSARPQRPPSGGPSNSSRRSVTLNSAPERRRAGRSHSGGRRRPRSRSPQNVRRTLPREVGSGRGRSRGRSRSPRGRSRSRRRDRR
eukprot:TRINITY_DN10166_c0_g1_i1.p1 TRINITY_DN10166_c0_g1~~TRINITY_DN10166_c0_g1_i1.p1  ORF type:complete len:783 (-),score=149.52 TRINITY_DN10166_c0_g1_i1:8-2317(-)